MSGTQNNFTLVYVENDIALHVNQDYRIMNPGLNLTLPKCEVGDFICLVPFMAPGDGAPVKIKRADGVTLDGSANDSNMSNAATAVLRGTGQNEWTEI